MTAPTVRRIDPAAPDQSIIDEAARQIRSGGLVAFPTETVYGLGANALDPSAVARVFAAKGRPSTNPLICHVADADDARQQLAAVWPPHATTLARAFWPGPLTLVVPARLHLPSIVTAGTDTVAIRAPAHPVAQALLRAACRPIAAPSANRSTGISPTTAAHVQSSLGAAAEFLLDGGPTDVGIESTVLDLTGPQPVLLRLGSISREQLEAIVGPVLVAGGTDAEGAAARAPGRQARHYAPATPVRLHRDVSTLRQSPSGDRRALLVREGDDVPTAITVVERLPADAAGYARHLYAALHRLDASGCDEIHVLLPPDTADWAAVRDRLGRAAHA